MGGSCDWSKIHQITGGSCDRSRLPKYGWQLSRPSVHHHLCDLPSLRYPKVRCMCTSTVISASNCACVCASLVKTCAGILWQDCWLYFLLSTERTYLYVSFFGTYGLQVDSRACAYKHEYQLYCLEGFFNAGQCGWLGPSLVWGLLTCTR